MRKAEARQDAAEAARRADALAVGFAAGDVIYQPRDPARGWIVLESGRVKVSLTADPARSKSAPDASATRGLRRRPRSMGAAAARASSGATFA